MVGVSMSSVRTAKTHEVAVLLNVETITDGAVPARIQAVLLAWHLAGWTLPGRRWSQRRGASEHRLWSPGYRGAVAQGGLVGDGIGAVSPTLVGDVRYQVPRLRSPWALQRAFAGKEPAHNRGAQKAARADRLGGSFQRARNDQAARVRVRSAWRGAVTVGTGWHTS